MRHPVGLMHCWKEVNHYLIQMIQIQMRLRLRLSHCKSRWLFVFNYFWDYHIFWLCHENRKSYCFLFLSLYTQKSKTLTRKDPAEEFLAMYSNSPPSVSHHDKNLTKTVVELKQEIQDLKEENAHLKDLLVQGINIVTYFTIRQPKHLETLSPYFILYSRMMIFCV